jgi:hypothetical protein
MISNMMKNIYGISDGGSFLLSGFQPFEKGGRQQPKAARTFSPLAVGLTADGAFSPSCPCRADRRRQQKLFTDTTGVLQNSE